MDEAMDEFQAYLIEKGALELYGMTEDGEISFRFNIPVLKEVFFPLYEEIMKDIDDTILELYKEGLVEISYDDDLNAIVGISDEAYDVLKARGYDLPDFLKDNN